MMSILGPALWPTFLLVITLLVAATFMTLSLRRRHKDALLLHRDSNRIADGQLEIALHSETPQLKDKKTLVLVHGIGASRFIWRKLVQELNFEFCIFTVDLPGFGQAPRPHEHTYRLQNLANNLKILEEQLQSLGNRRIHWVGSSMGAALILFAAQRGFIQPESIYALSPALNPQRVPRWVPSHWTPRALKLLQSRMGPRMMKVLIRSVVSSKTKVTQEMIEGYLRPYTDGHAIEASHQALSILKDPRLVEVRSAPCPVFFLTGQKDLQVPLREVHALSEEWLSQVQLAVHPYAAHHIMEDDPVWVATQIRSTS